MSYTLADSSFNDSASATSLGVTLAGAPAEDALVIGVVHVNADSETITDDTGSGAAYTHEYQDIDSPESNTHSFLHKNAGASEPSVYTFGIAGSAVRMGAVVLVFTPDSDTSSVDAKDNGYDAAENSADVLTSILGTDGGVSIAVTMRDRSNGTGTIDNGYTIIEDAQQQRTVVAYKLLTATGAIGTTTFTPGGTDDTASWIHISFKHAAGGGGGRVMGSIAGQGGLAGHGGLAGFGGGLAARTAGCIARVGGGFHGRRLAA